MGTRWRNACLVVAVVAVGMMLVFGCGQDDDASTTDSTTTSVEDAGTPETTDFATGWRQANNGFGARVIAHSDTLGVVAIDDRGVVWWSAEGVAWEATNNGTPLTDTPFTRVIAGGPGFVAIAEDRMEPPTYPRLWVSADGMSWERLPEDVLVAPSTPLFIRGIAASPAGVLITESLGGYWLSSDGLTWERYASEDFIATGGVRGFAGVRTEGFEIVLSADGRSFESTGRAGLGFCPGTTPLIYDESLVAVAWCRGGSDPAVIDTSVDNGLTWTRARNNQVQGEPISLTGSSELGLFAAYKTADSRLALLHRDEEAGWLHVPLAEPVPAPSQLLAVGTRLLAIMGGEEGQPAQEMWVWAADANAV